MNIEVNKYYTIIVLPSSGTFSINAAMESIVPFFGFDNKASEEQTDSEAIPELIKLPSCSIQAYDAQAAKASIKASHCKLAIDDISAVDNPRRLYTKSPK